MALGNLLENKLFLQYLSSGGAALSRGESLASGINPVTQQNIAAQSKAALQDRYIKKLAGKGLGATFDPEGKVTIKAENMQQLIDILGGESELGSVDPQKDLAMEGSALPGGSGTDWAGFQSRFLNPQGSPSITGADLAGLSTQDISQALTDAMGVVSLPTDLGLKRAQIDKLRADIAKGKDTSYEDALIAKMRADTNLSYLRQGMDVKRYELMEGDLDLKNRIYELNELVKNKQLTLQEARDKVDALYKKKLGAATDIRAGAAGKPKQPTPVNWSTATKELTKRFGKLDPTGMWAVTPELQATHRKAQEFLVEMKDAGMDPLRAVNNAEKKANEWMRRREERYFQYIDAAGKDKDSIDKVNSAFHKQYGYLPSR